MSALHQLVPARLQEAIGAVEAQRVIADIRAGLVTPMHAWLRLCELGATHSPKSPACRAFLLELAKRAAAPGA